MKKILIIALLWSLAAWPVLAQTESATEDTAEAPVPALYDSAKVAEPDSLPPAPPAPPAAIQEMKRERQQEGTGGAADQEQNQGKNKSKTTKTNGKNEGQGETRRSRVASAVEALLSVAERSGGIGPQVREVAREQIQLADQAENKLEQAKQVSKLNKFFWGADYRTLKDAGKDLKGIDRSLRKLEALAKDPALTAEDKALINTQAAELNATRTELLAKVRAEADGFALFGWLAKILNGYNVGE